MSNEQQPLCEWWAKAVAPILGAVDTFRVAPTPRAGVFVLTWANEPGDLPNQNGVTLEGEPTLQALEDLRLHLGLLGYPRKAAGEWETHTLHVKLVDNARLGPTPDLGWMAGMWQHWLEPQLSSTLVVLPCPHSRTELVATWLSPAGGPRHAFRFEGGVVLPTRETMGELAHNLHELAGGRPLRAGSLLRPEPLHFEQVVEVLKVLRQREQRAMTEYVAASKAALDRRIWEGDETEEERQRREAAVPPAERGAFLRGIVDKLSGGRPSPTMQRLVDGFQGGAQAPLPPELSVADGPVPSPNPGPSILERAQQLVGGIVIDDPHPEAQREAARQDWLLYPAQPPSTPGEWFTAAAMALRNAWQSEIRTEDGSFRDGAPDRVLGNELSHLIGKVHQLREQREERAEGAMVEGVNAHEVWTIGQKPRTDGTHAVHLGPGVQAALVEALAPMHVWGTHASGRPLAAGERFVWVDREASTEGLHVLHESISKELARRSDERWAKERGQ